MRFTPQKWFTDGGTDISIGAESRIEVLDCYHYKGKQEYEIDA